MGNILIQTFRQEFTKRKKREKLLEILFLRKWRNVSVRNSVVWLVETVWLEKQHSADFSNLPLVIIFDRSYSSPKQTVLVY